MKKLFRSAAMVALVTVASGTIVGVLGGTAESATAPPWESGSPPAVSPNEVGGLTFYNSSGQVITGGNLSDKPIAAYIQGNTALQASPTVADLDGYTPTQNGVPVTSPGNWNDFSFGSSNLPSSAPGALGTSSLPVYTGQSYSLSELTTGFPNTDTSTTDGYAGLYVLHLRTFHHPNTSSTYDSADISVNTSTGTWSLDYSPQAATTTTLLAPTPASPQSTGTSVTLTADVTDPSAPGTVQFESGGTNVGSPQAVTNGVATLATTALPVGNPDSLTAVFTPTTGAAFSGSTSNTVQYIVSPPPAGGVITLAKSTALIGNYADKVSGTGWTADATVSLNECTSTTYSAATCDAANRANVTLLTGRAAGTFKSAVIEVAVGTIDSHGDTCGVAGSTTCYIVAVGNTGDTTSSAELGFTLPSIVVKRTTALLGNNADVVAALGFPIGDTVVAHECDSSVLAPSTVSTNCDSATAISGTAGATGKVVFSPATGVTVRVGSAYSDSANGSVTPGGTAEIALTDSNNSVIGVSESVGFASPVISLKATSNLLGNYVDPVKASGFPIGDTVVAQECDSNLVFPTNVASDCDGATAISGTVGASGKVTFSPTGVTLKIGSAYSDGAGGCLAGGTCEVVVSDQGNPGIGLVDAVTFTTPAASVKESSNVAANYVDKVTATNFAVGDTVTAEECDSTVTSVNLASHCDNSGTQITGTVSPKGVVTFSAAGVKVLVGGAYTDGASGSVTTGGSADIVVNDSTDGAFVAVPITLAS